MGFQGGELKQMADHVVHLEIDNYGIAENTHQSVMRPYLVRVEAVRMPKATV